MNYCVMIKVNFPFVCINFARIDIFEDVFEIIAAFFENYLMNLTIFESIVTLIP